MARLPVYTNNANIQVADRAPAPTNPWKDVQDNAQAVMDLSVQWQKTQNAAESLDGKNKMVAAANDILTEAEEYRDYKSPKDLQTKEKELLSRMEGVLPEVTGGFTNSMNAGNFSREYQLTMAQNSERLKQIFREKYIDNDAANRTLSYQNNMKAFVESGNAAYKQSYLTDLENSFNAGYITEQEKTAQALKVKDWDFSFASRQMINDPEGALSNINSFKITPEEKQKLQKAALTQIENKKLFSGLSELVDKGTEGNRLYEKFLSEGLSLDEIQRNDKISENEKTALLKLSGYDTATFKQAQKNAESITKQLELDEKIKNTIKGTKERPKLDSKKDIQDALDLREDVYTLLVNGDITKEKGRQYLSQIVGATLREAKSLVDNEDKSKDINNPYAEGLKRIDEYLEAQGIDNDQIKAGIHNLYFEAMADQMSKNNPQDLSWSELDDKTSRSIQETATKYALEYAPQVMEANETFSYYLPASERKEAMESFYKQYDRNMNEAQRKELAKQVAGQQALKAQGKKNISIENANYTFSDSDNAFLKENKFTPEEVIFTAQTRGLSVSEVLKKLKEKK